MLLVHRRRGSCTPMMNEVFYCCRRLRHIQTGWSLPPLWSHNPHDEPTPFSMKQRSFPSGHYPSIGQYRSCCIESHVSQGTFDNDHWHTGSLCLNESGYLPPAFSFEWQAIKLFHREKQHLFSRLLCALHLFSDSVLHPTVPFRGQGRACLPCSSRILTVMPCGACA